VSWFAVEQAVTMLEQRGAPDAYTTLWKRVEGGDLAAKLAVARATGHPDADQLATEISRVESCHLDVGEVAPAPTGSLGAVEHSPPFLLVPLTHNRSRHARNSSAASRCELLAGRSLRSPAVVSRTAAGHGGCRR
jgi:hypothetical protein